MIPLATCTSSRRAVCTRACWSCRFCKRDLWVLLRNPAARTQVPDCKHRWGSLARRSCYRRGKQERTAHRCKSKHIHQFSNRKPRLGWQHTAPAARFHQGRAGNEAVVRIWLQCKLGRAGTRTWGSLPYLRHNRRGSSACILALDTLPKGKPLERVCTSHPARVDKQSPRSSHRQDKVFQFRERDRNHCTTQGQDCRRTWDNR